MTFMPKTDIDRLNLLNSNEKVDLELGLLASDYTYRQNKGGVAGILSSLGETSAYKAGGWNALSQTAQNQINQLRNTNTDWNDILFRNALTQEYNIGISGGGDKSDYYTSVGYTLPYMPTSVSRIPISLIATALPTRYIIPDWQTHTSPHTMRTVTTTTIPTCRARRIPRSTSISSRRDPMPTPSAATVR